MSLPPTVAERLLRFSLLEPVRTDIPHPVLKGRRVVGWTIIPDEFWSCGDGYKFVEAWEREAQINPTSQRQHLLKNLAQ